MSEELLNALMHLFAIIASVEQSEVSANARKIVESYLKQHLSKEQVDDYLKLFDNYLNFHITNRKEREISKKKVSSNSVKVLKICNQINEVLHQKEKIVVLLRLIEFVNVDGKIHAKEYDFVKTVSEAFNISDDEFENISAIVLGKPEMVMQKNKILVVNNNQPTVQQNEGKWLDENKPAHLMPVKHIFNENLVGEFLFLHIESIDIFIFTYSGNQTLFVKGRNIRPNHAYIFDNGSIIKGQRISPIYYSDISGRFLQASSKTHIVFCGEELEFKFKKSENGIQKINFIKETGELVGIMGGSGVGKSTLFSLLSGKLVPQKGRITINGHDIHKEKDKLEGIIGFVPQDDLLIEELTVYQNLYYNAKLCFDNFNEKQLDDAVKKILVDLDLDAIRNLTVGNALNKFISGGQRKRLNIALELIREPSILFVDEPTSGLSSTDSENVMQLLKQQTLKGKLVIVNIHQPSSDIFKLFDALWIMDKGGHLIYQGNPIDALVYFKRMSNHLNAEESECAVCGNVNPEQILQIVEAKVVNEFGEYTLNRKINAKEWYKLYLENIESNLPKKEIPHELPVINFKIPNLWKQFKVFSIRNILSKLTNQQYLLINFLEAPVLALILGFFTKYLTDEGLYIFAENKNIPIYLFMNVVVALFMGLSVSAEEIIKDRRILAREQFLNLSRFSYINSKILVLFVISAIQTITFILVGNTILGIKDMTLTFWLILFSTSAFANMVGLNISSGLNSVITIYILIPLILVPQLLLGGAMVDFDDLHPSLTKKIYVPAVGDIMVSRWAYEALCVEQFKNNEFEKHFYEIEKKKSDAVFLSSYLISELQNKSDKCKKLIGSKKSEKTLAHNLKVISNELAIISTLTDAKNIDFNFTDKLTTAKYNEQTAVKLKKTLDTLKTIYSNAAVNANAARDSIYNALVKKMGKEKLLQLKDKYYNKSMEDFVYNKDRVKKIYETEGRLIRKYNPIFTYPENNYGRAHFYAPVKKVFGYYIDTLWFNIIFIWITAVLLYFTLLYDVLKKVLSYLENIKLRRK